MDIIYLCFPIMFLHLLEYSIFFRKDLSYNYLFELFLFLVLLEFLSRLQLTFFHFIFYFFFLRKLLTCVLLNYICISSSSQQFYQLDFLFTKHIIPNDVSFFSSFQILLAHFFSYELSGTFSTILTNSGDIKHHFSHSCLW